MTQNKNQSKKQSKNQNKSQNQNQKSKKNRNNRFAALVIGLLLVMVIGGIVFAAGRSVQTIRILHDVTIIIDGEDVSRLSEEKAVKLLEDKYPWDMTVVYGEHSEKVDNYLDSEIRWAVHQAFQEAAELSSEEKKQTLWERLRGNDEEEEPIVVNHELVMPIGQHVAEELAGKLTAEWGHPATNASIVSFNESTGEFVVEEGKSGTEIDEQKLLEAIAAAVDERDFVRSITVPEKSVEPEIKASSYKVMSTYQTNTTASQDRNTNVRLAAEAVNGTILQPGEQLSFNTVVGRRTPEKGYKQAPAYADGQTVQEYGGGVCQVSSTLYNAVIGAGLQTDVRTGHTFEPSYVTPGQDATVSYAEPDFVFTNSSQATIGIKAFYSDRKMYVEIYGVPVLEEGVTRYMRSEKTADLDPPAPTYVESPDIPFGTEMIQKAGTIGSIWVTYIVTEKDGAVIDEEYLHQTRYKGHNATILRNTQYPDGGQPAVDPNAGQPQPAPAPAPQPQPDPQPQPEPQPQAEVQPESQPAPQTLPEPADQPESSAQTESSVPTVP